MIWMSSVTIPFSHYKFPHTKSLWTLDNNFFILNYSSFPMIHSLPNLSILWKPSNRSAPHTNPKRLEGLFERNIGTFSVCASPWVTNTQEQNIFALHSQTWNSVLWHSEPLHIFSWIPGILTFKTCCRLLKLCHTEKTIE